MKNAVNFIKMKGICLNKFKKNEILKKIFCMHKFH